MPRIEIAKAGVVALGQTFAPANLKADVFRSFLKKETPRGISTNVLSQLEYPDSGYLVTLEEQKFQVVKNQPAAKDLTLLASLTRHFLKQNPLVTLTAVGLNYSGFIRYEARKRDSKKFLTHLIAVGNVEALVEAKVEDALLQSVYFTDGCRCRLALRSDARVNDNDGVGVDLNVHREIKKKSEVQTHISALKRWHSRFRATCGRLAKVV